MFTSKVWTDDSKLLQELNLAPRQLCKALHHVLQATTSEGLARGPYVAASGFDPATFLVIEIVNVIQPFHLTLKAAIFGSC